MNLGLNKVLKFTTSMWRNIGTLAIQLIREDASKGIFQTPGGSCTKSSYNRDYAKYKANAMRRFTKAGVKTYLGSGFGASGIKYMGVKKLKVYAHTMKGQYRIGGYDSTHGKKIKAYEGVSVKETNTSVVNMRVTGHTLDGLKIRGNPTDKGVIIGYDTKDVKKIIGNKEKYNRDLVGLNTKNRELVKDYLIEHLDANVRQFGQINIKLNIT